MILRMPSTVALSTGLPRMKFLFSVTSLSETAARMPEMQMLAMPSHMGLPVTCADVVWWW